MTINPASLPTVPPSPQDGLPLQVTVGELPIGTVQKVGDYKILGTLGSGGMGIVYKAFDQKLGRIVALKMLQVGREASHEEVLRFRTEAEMLGRLQHPNIVQVFDFGIHDGAPFLVMEFVNGGSLEKRLQGTPQQPRRAAEWIEQIARAMHVAHENKVIHRDLKPANVLITIEGSPKITDFGLAKQMEASHGLTQTGAIMGTPSYMAPEQAEGKKDVGPPADIYSLGAMLYECLTGRPPFRGATLQETLEQVCNADPAPPSRLVPRLPRDLQTICLKCLEKAPGRRYRTAGDLADDLKNWLDGLPVKARPTHSIERMFRYVARRPLRAALVLTSLLVVVFAVISGLFYRDMRNTEEANRKQAELRDVAEKQKEETNKANRQADEARQSLLNLRETMQMLRGDRKLDEMEAKLGEQVKRLGSDESSAEKAMVLAELYADVAGRWRSQGEVDRGIGALDQAEKLAARADHRGDLEVQMKRARIYQERALMRCETVPAKAVEDCRKALALLDEVKQAGADNPAYDRLRAETLHDLAVSTAGLAVLVPSGDGTARRKGEAAAEESYRQAESLLRRLVARKAGASHDEDRRNLARTLGYLGDLYLELDKRQEADEAYWESHHIREKLAEEKPRDYERKYQLARSWDNFGGYQTRQRNLSSALHFYGESEKLRAELNRRQPDNKDYVLELAGVMNRIGELELFAAEPAKSTSRLDQAKDRLEKCEAMLKKLLDVLREDEEQNKEAIPRACSLLGECLSLQAREGLIRYDLSGGKDRKALEDARLDGRRAGDVYAEVKERRQNQPLGLGDRYQEVTAQLISLNVWKDTRASEEEKKAIPQLYAKHAKTLGEVLKGGFRRLSPEEIWRDRAFRAVRERPEFRLLLRRDAQEGKDGPTKDHKPALAGQSSEGK